MDLLGMIIDSRLEQSNNFRDTFLEQHDDFVKTQTEASKAMVRQIYALSHELQHIISRCVCVCVRVCVCYVLSGQTRENFRKLG